METTTRTVSDLIDDDTGCPIPLRVIPDCMGINLCSVSMISWSRRDDGQLVELVISFSPEEKS